MAIIIIRNGGRERERVSTARSSDVARRVCVLN